MTRRREAQVASVLASYGVDMIVLAEYDLQPERIEPARGALRIDTAAGTKMLKRSRTTRAQLAFVKGYLDYLAMRGFRAIPRFIRNQYGDDYVVDDNRLYYVTNWLQGSTPDLRNPNRLVRAAQTLGELHAAGTGYEAAGDASPMRLEEDFRSKWHAGRERWKEFANEAFRKSSPTELDMLMREVYEEQLDAMNLALQVLDESPYAEAMIAVREEHFVCHGSYCRQNLLEDGAVWSVVDFDHAHYGHPVAELAQFLHRYLSRLEWNPSIGRSVVQAYARSRTLSVKEVELLGVCLLWPERVYQVFGWYYDKSRPWDLDRFEDEVDRVLEEDEGRIPFVEELYGSIGSPVPWEEAGEGESSPAAPVPDTPLEAVRQAVDARPAARGGQRGQDQADIAEAASARMPIKRGKPSRIRVQTAAHRSAKAAGVPGAPWLRSGGPEGGGRSTP